MPASMFPACLLSLPTRERGLKSYIVGDFVLVDAVAPYTGAWIEIISDTAKAEIKAGRSLHGSVD